MKKIFTSLLFCSILVSSSIGQTRYIDPIFSSFDVTPNILYSQNFSVLLESSFGVIPTGTAPIPPLVFDLYEPTGDTEAERPLIIHLHTGTFAPIIHNGNPTGMRQDFATTTICEEYAKRGYVVANLEYRLGWDPNLATEAERATSLMKAVYRAIQDAKSAVRFFRSDYINNGNSYRIDTSRIILSGQGSGGWVAMGYATVDKLAEIQLPKFLDGNAIPLIDTAVIGDWDGYGGDPTLNMESNAGFSNDIHMVVSMGGGLGDLSWLEAGDVPMCAVHCPTDPIAIYSTGNVTVNGVNITTDISGSHDIIKKANMLGNNNKIITLYDSTTLVAKQVSNTVVGTMDLGGTTITDEVDNLYPFVTGNPYESSPWDFWDSTATVDLIAPGVGLTAQDGIDAHLNGLLTNPDMGYLKAIAYINSSLAYFCPRIVNALDLPGNNVNVEEQSISSQLDMYPNPAYSTVNIVASQEISKIEIFNTTGKLVALKEGLFNKTFQFSYLGLPSGVYFVNIYTPIGLNTKKLIIK
jgi:hypothetical protein